MNLYQFVQQLAVTTFHNDGVPDYLWGSFRRKNITFFNGSSDEKTIVYWFQSLNFSIDLRLLDAQQTPLLMRQGWVGDSTWCEQTQLLSWQISQSYQLHTQWPEPAQLYPIGNCILEFAPSKAYVEDWRQQSSQGLFLGLKLYAMQQNGCDHLIPLQGGLIIAGEHVAFAQSRPSSIQAKLDHYAHLKQFALTNNPASNTTTNAATNAVLTPLAIENHAPEQDNTISMADVSAYEVSVALNGSRIVYSTQDHRVNQNIDLDGFRLGHGGEIIQEKMIHGVLHKLYYQLDVYCPQYQFQQRTNTSAAAENWFAQEADHLQFHAQTLR